MKKLPIGIQTFRDIITEGFVYVDKTGIAYDIITKGRYYFLSRPRRQTVKLPTKANYFRLFSADCGYR